MPLRTGAVFLVKLLSLGGQFHGIGPHVGAGPLQQPLFLEADDEARYRRLVAPGCVVRLVKPEKRVGAWFESRALGHR